MGAVAIAQNVDRAVLMQGFINRDALLQTISSRKATFYSRSRATLWTKGETSMNFINVSDILHDCDCDSVNGNKLALTTLYSLESTVANRKKSYPNSHTANNLGPNDYCLLISYCAQISDLYHTMVLLCYPSNLEIEVCTIKTRVANHNE